jgi:hypothetical protein
MEYNAMVLLASPGIPGEIAGTAIELAQQGKHITLEAAEAMVAEHVAEAVRQVRAEQRGLISQAVTAEGATTRRPALPVAPCDR